MAFDELYLVNRMLLKTGETTISSLGKDTKQQRLVESIYDGIVYEVFHFKVNWHFATTRVQLAELATEPAFGWDHQYAFPAACVRILETVDSEGDTINYPYRKEVVLTTANKRTVETDVLLSNQETAYVKYVFLRKDPASWPGWFQNLVILHGARQLVAPIKKDDFRSLELKDMFNDALARAKGANAAEEMDTSDLGVDEDKGNTDFLDRTQEAEGIIPWNTQSLNRD